MRLGPSLRSLRQPVPHPGRGREQRAVVYHTGFHPCFVLALPTSKAGKSKTCFASLHYRWRLSRDPVWPMRQGEISGAGVGNFPPVTRKRDGGHTFSCCPACLFCYFLLWIVQLRQPCCDREGKTMEEMDSEPTRCRAPAPAPETPTCQLFPL